MPDAVDERDVEPESVLNEPFDGNLAEGGLDALARAAVREAKGLVDTGSEGGRAMGKGRARAWGPQNAKAEPYAARSALLEPILAKPMGSRDRPEVGGGRKERQECGQHP